MQFLSTVCMAAIASALFRLLVPENRFAKQISLLVAALFLLAGINAVKSADFSFEDSPATSTRSFRRRYAVKCLTSFIRC